MRLVIYCKNCHSRNRIGEKASDRYRLSQKIGEEFDWKCSNCASINPYSVDDVEAEHGLKGLMYFLSILIIAICAGFFLLKNYFMISTWWLIPALIAIPISFYSVVSNEENKKIRTFNRFKLKI